MMYRRIATSFAIGLAMTTSQSAAFRSSSCCCRPTDWPGHHVRVTADRHYYLTSGSNEEDISPLLPEVVGSSVLTIWNPIGRQIMGGLASLGAVETLYLTYSDLQGLSSTGNNNPLLFCSESGSGCSSVLSSSYAHIPGTDVPIAVVGAVAYLVVFGLAVAPLLERSDPQNSVPNVNDDDSLNRLLLLATTTTMGVFSVFLMSILVNVLHQTCLYCIVSAICSIGLMSLAWTGGALPSKLNKEGVLLSIGGGMFSMLAALVIVVANVPSDNMANTVSSVGTSGSITSTLLATTESFQRNSPSIVTSQEPPVLLVDQLPPAITTESSSTALQLAADLQKLDARFYGAYWCSHCYDQKQAFGKQAMQRIPYVECSREGKDEQAGLCKEKKIPGYPTWEISGKLYPGEKDLDEIRDIVAKAMVKGAQ